MFAGDVRCAEPRIEFDAADLVAFHEVIDFAPPEPGAAGDRTIEVPLEVSSLIRRGTDRDVVHFLYRIEFADPRTSLLDYLPKTELASNVAGPVAVERKTEDAVTVGGGITGSHDSVARATANLAANKTKADRASVRYEMIPPKELIAASGTINRRHGVYFKLKPSRQTSLEGAKKFVCVLRVPAHWRGGLVRVRCTATARSQNPISTGLVTCGQADYLVGIYADGDTAAREAVWQLSKAQSDLEKLTEEHRRYRGSVRTLAMQKVDAVGDALEALAPGRISARMRGLPIETSPPPEDEWTRRIRQAESRRTQAAEALAQPVRRHASPNVRR